MNSNRKVFLFVLSSILLYLLISVMDLIFDFNFLPLQRINLISEIAGKRKTVEPDIPDTTNIVVKAKAGKSFGLYHSAHVITNFSADTNSISIPRFIEKLQQLKNGEKKKIRIAYFGDSMIEGDLLTQTLRELLQEYFGGNGVGFVPITSTVSKFRQTVYANYSTGWKDENFKEGNSNKLYFSGHLFRGAADWVYMTDQTIRDSAAIIEKSILCGINKTPSSIIVNNSAFSLQADSLFNRIPVERSKLNSIRVSVSNEQIPVYGISFESESGVFVDNFSFRGITGIELNRIDSTFLAAIAKNNPYDLIVFQYGVNLLFRPNDKDYSWYAKMMAPVVRKFRNCFPETDMVIVSTADRAFRYADGYKSAIGIDSLIKVQAVMAFESGCSFYNQYKTMGGKNSIVEWAGMKPSLANKDYVHPNHRGAEILARYFFEAIMKEYRKTSINKSSK